jgi:hypothetical protein
MMTITFKCDGGADATNPQEPSFTAETT